MNAQTGRCAVYGKACAGGVALALLMSAGCEKKVATEEAVVDSEPSASTSQYQAPAPAVDEGARERARSLYASFAGVWADDGGCLDPGREWRIDERAFHFGETACDILLIDAASPGVRAVADCMIEGYSDGAEDSFLFTPKEEGHLSIVDETIGVETAVLAKCRGLAE